MAATILRSAEAIAIPPATALSLRHYQTAFLHGAGRLRFRFPSLRIPQLRRAAAAMTPSVVMSSTHEAGPWYAVPGLSLRDHLFAIPLDYSDPDAASSIIVFAREVVASKSHMPSSPFCDPRRRVVSCVEAVAYAGCVGLFVGKRDHNSLD
jgi:hypothetical protein